MKNSKATQLAMNLQTVHRTCGRGRGGWRPGAGRKPSKANPRHVQHRARPRVDRHHPAIVTLKLRPEVRNLRTKDRVRVLHRAFVAACQRTGFRIVDWSIQHNHLHLIVEADCTGAMSRGMQGFGVRVAKGLNGLRGARGPVLAERYHVRILGTPREVRNSRAYVINNHRRHEARLGRVLPQGWVDPFSSAAWFDGWADWTEAQVRQFGAAGDGERPVVSAESWLLRIGWRRHGLVRVSEVPGGCG